MGDDCRKIRIGIMGFGQIGRQLYRLAAEGGDMEIVAISDIGKPEILTYLLNAETSVDANYIYKNNYLISNKFFTRMLQTDRPEEVPWDLMNVDMVVDATGKFRSRAKMEAHLANGARRVLISTLPTDYIDRLIIPGINNHTAVVTDRMVSAGSATTNAMALVLKILGDAFSVRFASMTTIHAYTSDQSLQDYVGRDFRRSRSAAENIIPNTTESCAWVEKVIPALAGRLSGYALNVPVQKGSLLDLNIVFADEKVGVKEVNKVMQDAAGTYAGLVALTEDPIVSSDVIGNRHSALFDLKGTLAAGKHMVKTLSWYESLGHACRILDVARLYTSLDRQEAGQ